MKYILESNWSNPFRDDGWETKTLHSPQGRIFADKDTAVRSLRRMADLSRIVCNVRVIDEAGTIHAVYNSENDTRLPGCRHRLIQKAAENFWDEAGRPDDRDDEFWLRAESVLIESNGVEVFI